MKLSSALIVQTLEKEFSILTKHNFFMGGVYLRPVFYDEKSGLPDEHICLASLSDIKQDVSSVNRGLGSVLLILTADKKKDLTFLGCPCILLEGSATLPYISNCLQHLFDECEAWEKRLNDIVLQGGTIRELLQASDKLLGNPMSVLGQDFSRVAEHKTDRIPSKLQLFPGDSLNMEHATALMQDEAYQALDEAREPVFFPASITGLRSLNLSLTVEDQPLHRLIVIEQNRTILEGDKCLLEILGLYVKYLLYREQSPAPKQTDALRKLFVTVLSDRAADYMESSQRLSALGWSSHHSYLCLIFQITYLDQKSITTKAISGYLQKQFPDCCSFFFKDEIVTFFNLTKLSMDKDDIAGQLTYFIRDSFLKAGYSRSMTGHMNLRRQYMQASTALDVGSRKNPYLWIHHFNQVALTYILEQCTRRLPGYMLCHEKLLELQSLDEEQNSEYMLTLKTYLDENLNATQSAAALFIHRSTFLYRLDKIKAILESSLEDPDELFYLRLSFHLLEQEAEKN